MLYRRVLKCQRNVFRLRADALYFVLPRLCLGRVIPHRSSDLCQDFRVARSTYRLNFSLKRNFRLFFRCRCPPRVLFHDRTCFVIKWIPLRTFRFRSRLNRLISIRGLSTNRRQRKNASSPYCSILRRKRVRIQSRARLRRSFVDRRANSDHTRTQGVVNGYLFLILLNRFRFVIYVLRSRVIYRNDLGTFVRHVNFLSRDPVRTHPACR